MTPTPRERRAHPNPVGFFVLVQPICDRLTPWPHRITCIENETTTASSTAHPRIHPQYLDDVCERACINLERLQCPESFWDMAG